jgi:hypothetical protein
MNGISFNHILFLENSVPCTQGILSKITSRSIIIVDYKEENLEREDRIDNYDFPKAL